MTPIDIEWYASAPYPPPGWLVGTRTTIRTDGSRQFRDIVASRGSDGITWTWEDGAWLVHRSRLGTSGTMVKVDPIIAETLRLYALGLRRPVTKEGER